MLENLLLFPRALRLAGLPISFEQSLSFTRALEWVDLGEREQVFYTARSLLVIRHQDLRLFEAVFQRFFGLHRPTATHGPRKAPLAPRHDPKRPRPFTLVGYLAQKARQHDPELELADRAGTFSSEEILQQKDFSRLSPEELENVRRLLSEMRFEPSRRTTRRLVSDPRGRSIDLRATLREAVRLGAMPARLPRQRRKVKQRPVVLLADISGSMEKYSRLLLELFYCVAHNLGQVESFVFGTRLSRITPLLAIRNIDRALEAVGLRVLDWSGGTRIGDSLGEFNRRWSRRVLRRGAVVLIASDGWERGDTSRLRREMRYLHDRCHRLIWLNPLLGQAGYRPLVEGMAAALPSIDDFLPIHNLNSLRQLGEHLGSLPARRGAAVSTEALSMPSNNRRRSHR